MLVVKGLDDTLDLSIAITADAVHIWRHELVKASPFYNTFLFKAESILN